MAFQPAPSIIEVDIRSTLFAQQVESTLYFQVAGTPTAGDVLVLAGLVEAWFVLEVLPNLGSNVVYRETYARSLESSAAPEATSNTSTGDVGGNPAGTLPNNVSWAVKFTTGLTGRSGRGRNFIYGIPENQVSGNDVTGIWAAAIVAAYEGLLDAPFTPDYTWVVLSRWSANLQRLNGVGFEINSVGFTDTVVDSQRRRLPGRGA